MADNTTDCPELEALFLRREGGKAWYRTEDGQEAEASWFGTCASGEDIFEAGGNGMFLRIPEGAALPLHTQFADDGNGCTVVLQSWHGKAEVGTEGGAVIPLPPGPPMVLEPGRAYRIAAVIGEAFIMCGSVPANRSFPHDPSADSAEPE